MVVSNIFWNLPPRFLFGVNVFPPIWPTTQHMFFSHLVFFLGKKTQKKHQPVAGYNCEELLGDILAQSFEGTFVPSAFRR